MEISINDRKTALTAHNVGKKRTRNRCCLVCLVVGEKSLLWEAFALLRLQDRLAKFVEQLRRGNGAQVQCGCRGEIQRGNAKFAGLFEMRLLFRTCTFQLVVDGGNSEA